ncbi:hypothetical protein [Piscirickettsia litoralis]|uniref:N-formylglutamate amidohydrolase n=1 Tax=Piscirickettsia litoralis TaxID=1891921 RepID=A0ABX2ZZL0_9GAMM|nr:hypothetical protein [Piscirickettsia litoralis]ODN42042.1 hypothetical protein BGC07_02570 [Piscirickettsia litoralis]
MHNQWPHPVDSISLNIPDIKVDLLHYQIPNPTQPHQPLFINLHDNEKTSVYAALNCIQQQNSGRLFEISHEKNRLISVLIDNQPCRFDPNRIFTDIGIENTLKDQKCFSKKNQFILSQYAQSIIHQIYTHSFPLLIALHNNEDNLESESKENYSILSYFPNGDESANTEDLYQNPAHCPDDFFITTKKPLFDYLRLKKFNTVLHKNQGVNDGSLSYYCSTQNIPYINVEAQHGHQQQQQHMIHTLFTYLKTAGYLFN